MPLLSLGRGRGAVNEEDDEILVENEHTPPTLNDDFGGQDHSVEDFCDEDAATFVPAALPPSLARNFYNIDLQRTEVLIANAPPDRHNFTFIVFYLLGVATMTPWNFFITAEDYWMYKFRNTTVNTTVELTPMQKSFTCDLTLTASIAGTAFLILNAIYGHRLSLRLKILGTLTVILIIFITTTVFVEVNTDKWQEQFFLITLFTVVIMNVSSATMSGGIFGIAGVFPSEYMTALVSGQALGGIFTALAFIMVLAFGAEPKVTAFIYFIIGGVLIALCILCYEIMSRQAFFKFYADGGAKYKILCDTPSHSRTLDSGVELEPNIKEIFSKIYTEAVSILVLFAVTLSVYPAVTVLTTSQNYGSGNAWSDIYFLPVVNYLAFNSGDYFGRVVAGFWERPRKNAHTVLLMTFIRVLYVPFFLCSHTNLHNFLPTLVHTDVAFTIMMITFALSNGYLANIILIMAPRSVMQHEKEVASSIMAASLSCGLALGSLLSMVFVQML